MNRDDFQALAHIRLDEAKVLLDAGYYDGAYCLAGYAVECALKACIAKLTREHDFSRDRRFLENVFTHDPVRLIKAAGLEEDLATERQLDPIFAESWILVTGWSEDSRYQRTSGDEARNSYNAITEPRHGVFRWLLGHW